MKKNYNQKHLQEGQTTRFMMKYQTDNSYAATAEYSGSAATGASAASNAFCVTTLTAIITVMAVVLSAHIYLPAILDILITIIIGGIILVIVRGEAEFISRT